MAQDAELPGSHDEQVRIALRWRRFLAFLIDGLIIFLSLMAVGFTFYDAAVSLGEWGRLVGVLVTTLYFGVFDGALGRGQTPGKRVLRIRVIRQDGALLSPAMAALRALIILTPFHLNGVPWFDDPTPLWADIVSALLIALMLSVLYLFIFNRSRRSLHDLLTGAVVIDAGAAEVAYHCPVWNGHWVVTGLLFVAMLGLAVTNFVDPTIDPQTEQLQAITRTVKAVPGVKRAGLGLHYESLATLRSGTSQRVLFVVVAVLPGPPTEPEALARQIEDAIFSGYPQMFGPLDVAIILRHGFTFGGVASANSDYRLMTSLAQWQARTKQLSL